MKSEEPLLITDPTPTPCQDGLKTETDSVLCQNEMEATSTSMLDPPNVPAGEQLCKRPSEQCGAGSGDNEHQKDCGEGKEQGVTILADEDFRKPKKRYRTPGGAASVRVRVQLLRDSYHDNVPTGVQEVSGKGSDIRGRRELCRP